MIVSEFGALFNAPDMMHHEGRVVPKATDI